MILKGPKNFSESFFDGLIVQILSELTKTLSPILKFGGGVWQQSADIEYHCCALDMVFQSSW